MKLEGYNVTIEQGEAMRLLAELPAGSVDALITDPPYSSGGFTRSDKAKDPTEKYQQGNQTKEWATFSGDNRDQRSWVLWMTLWLGLAQRALKPTGYVLLFTDWRQLPATTDAMQAGGFVWRGVVAWDKGRGSRAPHKGYFRHQCEYVVWGSNGPCHQATHDGPYDGAYTIPNKLSDKHHLTGKPTALMRELVRCVPQGGGRTRSLHGFRHHGRRLSSSGSRVHRLRARTTLLRGDAEAAPRSGER